MRGPYRIAGATPAPLWPLLPAVPPRLAGGIRGPSGPDQKKANAWTFQEKSDRPPEL